MIQFEGASRTSGTTRILQNVNLAFAPGQVHVVCGPNGSGKTSLLRALCGLDALDAGQIRIDHKPLGDMMVTERAQTMFWLPARNELPFAYPVFDVVSWGLWPQSAGHLTAEHRRSIDDALEIMKLTHLRTRPVTTLSLGEQQRVHLARMIASGRSILVTDEPCGPLDPQATLDLLGWMRHAASQHGKTIIISLHDLSFAARVADQVVLMRAGTVITCGSAGTVLTPANLMRVFDVDAAVVETRFGTMIAIGKNLNDA